MSMSRREVMALGAAAVLPIQAMSDVQPEPKRGGLFVFVTLVMADKIDRRKSNRFSFSCAFDDDSSFEIAQVEWVHVHMLAVQAAACISARDDLDLVCSFVEAGRDGRMEVLADPTVKLNDYLPEMVKEQRVDLVTYPTFAS